MPYIAVVLTDNKLIGPNHPPFIIVEMSGNLNHSLERALEIVEAVAKAGVHGLKFQTYTPDTLAIDLDEREFYIGGLDNLWSGTSLYKLYAEVNTTWE